MKEICYIDVTQLQGGAIFCKDYDLIFAGTTISSMPESNKDDTYIMLEDLYDICFIFDNHIPVVDFYAVPRIDIFAADSNNGFWGTIGDITDINNMFAPICYINNQKEIFIVAENFKIFYYQVASVQENINKKSNKTELVILYPSKEDAQKAIKFIEFTNLDR